MCERNDMSDRRERARMDTSAIRRYYRAVGKGEDAPPSGWPWLLAVPVLASIPAIIAGSIGPWFYREHADGRAGPEETGIVMGWQTDGVFSLVFAVVAAVTIVIAMVWPDREGLAWIGFIALALCAVVGLFDWVIFDPMELNLDSGQRPEVLRVEWGLKLVTFVGLIGAVCSFLLARQLTRGDF